MGRRWSKGRCATALAVGACLLILQPTECPRADEAPTPFTEEALARGLDFVMAEPGQAHGIYGQGAGFVDLDGDADPDVVIIGAASAVIGIFENIGGGMFVDRSGANGIPTLAKHEAFAAADYDADGLIDLYITQMGAPNVLMRNLGGFTFQNVTTTAGVGDNGPTFGASWGDFDGDGWLDLYVCNYSAFSSNKPNLLYRNLGNGTFTDVAEDHGVDSEANSFESVWTDYDRDGDLDLYVSNDRAPLGYPPNALYRNDGGTLVVPEEPTGAEVNLYSMGLAAGDFDGNLYPDYYVTNLNTTNPLYDGINPLLLNQGNGTFVEQAEVAGVDNRISSWGCIFFDYDNNGYLDLYVNNMNLQNSLFTNSGAFPCDEIGVDVGVGASYQADWDPEVEYIANIQSYSSAVADVDDDGDLDLLVNNIGSRAELFINNEGSKRSFVRYRVVGDDHNLNAVGVSIETTTADRTYFRESYAGGNGYLGQNELDVHVGLGDAESVEQAVVRWPGGGPVRTLTDLPVNKRWTIYPPDRLCDADGDGNVASGDWDVFAGCFGGLTQGCEMMDFDGDSFVGTADLDSCFVTAPSDCNGNGTEDLVEILFDAALDGNTDGVIDCCVGGGSTPAPNPVGATLVLDRGVGGPLLSWQAPGVDAGHDPALSYDVFRSDGDAAEGYGAPVNVATTIHEDSWGTSARVFYLVGSRNACGSSGEEPY